MSIRTQMAKELDLCGYNHSRALVENGLGKTYHVGLNRHTDSDSLNALRTESLQVAGKHISTLSGCDKVYRVFLLIILALTSEGGKNHLWAKSELADLGEIGLLNFASKYAEYLEFAHDQNTMKINYFRFSIFVGGEDVR